MRPWEAAIRATMLAVVSHCLQHLRTAVSRPWGSTGDVGLHTRPVGNPLRAPVLAIAACVFAAVNGGCAPSEGEINRYGVNLPAYVEMQRWDLPASGTCRGWLTNTGDKTAHDVRVYLWYSTAQGETAMVVTPSSANIAPFGSVAILAPPQVTGGELRFPRLGVVTWAGGNSGSAGDLPPRVFDWPEWCWLSADSARGWVHNPRDLAYHTVLTLETATGPVQVSLPQEPFGRLAMDPRDCPPPCACECDGYCTFNAPVRDSAGIKLRPKIRSIRWENSAGVADSLLPSYYYPDEASFICR